MHFKIFKMIATRGFLTAVECTKSVFGRGPRWGSSRRSPRPPSRLGNGTPPPHSHPSTPSASRSRRLRRLVLGAFGTSFPKPPPNFFLDTALSVTSTDTDVYWGWWLQTRIHLWSDFNSTTFYSHSTVTRVKRQWNDHGITSCGSWEKSWNQRQITVVNTA